MKFKNKISILTAIVMIMNILLFFPATVKAEEPTTWEPGQMKLTKTAELVPGKVNTWKVTVNVEGKDSQKPKDYIIVFDRSKSMEEKSYNEDGTEAGVRLDLAKDAAKELVHGIFADNPENRVGFISYSSAIYDAGTLHYSDTQHVTINNQLTDAENVSELETSIDGLTASGGKRFVYN